MSASVVFLSVLALVSVEASGQVQTRDNADDDRQISNHMRHLVEDLSTIVTYFEMDNSSVVVELARQVAQLRGDLAGLTDGMTELREDVRDLARTCGQQPADPERTTAAAVEPTSTPSPSIDPICGDHLLPVQLPGTPDGWTTCYQHVGSPFMSSRPLCKDLLVNLQGGYANSQQLLAAGGNFGCWRSSDGISGINPSRSCKNNYQQNGYLQSCTHCDIMGICIRYP